MSKCNPTGSHMTNPPRRSVCAKAGFTLIELIVAVTVLAVMTLLLARIISQSSSVMSEGARQATQNANARMALDFLAREFSQAAGDGRLHFRRDTTPGSPGEATTYGGTYPCHDLRFISFRSIYDFDEVPQPPKNREAVRLAYYVKRFTTTVNPTYSYYSLMRAEKPIEGGESYTNIAYNSINETAEAAELIRHVVEFRAVCYDTNATADVMNSAEKDHLPVYMDVYLAVLSENDARRASSLDSTPAAQKDFINRNAKRYHTRCWSVNRTAYLQGR